MTQSEQHEIKIDLNQLATQKSLTREGLIQRQVYDDLRDRIIKRLNWIETKASGLGSALPSGMGWVSFIDGTRGAGKSTFLHTALQLLKEEVNINDKLAVMDWIDPSRIEANEFILLIILNAIKERVNKNPGDKSEKNREVRDKLDKAFKEVAGGLVLFKKDHHPLNELDAELFLEIGLEEAGHSAKLRENLHELIKHACDLLQVKALLFSFDDADTKFEHAIDLLETLRKYLDTPRVMCVVTGDLELYTLLLRQNFRLYLTQGKRKEWGTEQVENPQRSQQQIRMLDHLEEQYLLKLFPLRERHHLLPIGRLASSQGAQDKASTFMLVAKDGEKPKELMAFVREKIQNGFRLSSNSDINLYCEFILMQPIRSVLQVLARLQEDQPEEAKGNSFHLAMLDLALHSLYQYNIAAEEIAAHDFRALCEAAFEVAMDDGDPDTSAYLRPTGAKAHNRAAMFGLSAAVAEQLKGKPGTSIAYLFRSPGMVKLAYEAADSNLRGFDSEFLLSEFKRHMGVGRIDDALGWARLATTALVAEYTINPRSRVIRHGVIGININRRDPFDQFLRDRSDGEKGEVLILPAAAFGLVKSSVTGARSFVSIFNILGLMSRLLQLVESPQWAMTSEDELKKTIALMLYGIYPNTNTVSAPPWTRREEPAEDDPIDSNGKDDKVAVDTHADWVDALLAWLKASASQFQFITPSSVMMGKIWVHMFNGLRAISDESRPLRDKNEFRYGFASFMELFALCAVNAFLVEESAYHLTVGNDRKPINLNNPRRSSDLYLKSLNKLNLDSNDLKKLPLTSIVASCPLITGLISRGFESLWPFKITDSDSFKWILKPAWEVLEAVEIQGPKNPPSEKPPSEKPPSEKPPSEKPPSEKPPSEKPPSETPPAKKRQPRRRADPSNES